MLCLLQMYKKDRIRGVCSGDAVFCRAGYSFSGAFHNNMYELHLANIRDDDIFKQLTSCGCLYSVRTHGNRLQPACPDPPVPP